MKYFKDESNNIFAYDSDGSQDSFIKPGLTPISEQEAMAIANPPPSTEQLAAQARAQRDVLLAESDFSQLPDAPVNSAAWATYRQALRDVPEQPGFPQTIEWPVKP